VIIYKDYKRAIDKITNFSLWDQKNRFKDNYWLQK